MDIKSALDAHLSAQLAKAAGPALNLKMDQQVEAKVVDTQLLLNTLAIKLGDKTVWVQTTPAIALTPGQTLQLQVSKLQPMTEFKLLASTTSPTSRLNTAELPIIKLLGSLPPNTASPPAASALTQWPSGQPLAARVINIVDSKVTMQLLGEPNANLGKTAQLLPATVLTLDAKQLLWQSSDSPQWTPLKASTLAAAGLSVGSNVNLQLLSTGKSSLFALAPQSPNSEQQVVASLKALLPIQIAPQQWLQQLNQSLPDLQADATVGETLKQLAQQILRAIPMTSQLGEPAQLQQSVDNSGLYLEAKLAALLQGRQTLNLQGDLKLNLVKLVQLLSQSLTQQADNDANPDTLQLLKDNLEKTQGALARLTLDQLNSLPKDDSPKQNWLIELPFFHHHQAESVKIAIELDKQRSAEQSPSNWAVSITLTPPELATIHCRISCHDGAINTRFWSDESATVAKINTHLDYLKQQLELKGLSIGFMEAHQGQSSPSNIAKTTLPNLLNEKV